MDLGQFSVPDESYFDPDLYNLEYFEREPQLYERACLVRDQYNTKIQVCFGF